MADSTSQINLEDILKITDIEFKKYFKDWLQNDEIANELQARLRRDLIVHFNKTSLGRKIFSKHIDSQRMIFSPLILVLNTLVSEFLYAQNCHYTLSVLCTEIPYRNTLPDFENIKNFRFNKNEISEIFEAINGKNMSNEVQHEICSEYLANLKGSIPLSLLYVIFKNLFKPNLALHSNTKQSVEEQSPKAEPGQSNRSIKNKIVENQTNTSKNIDKTEKENENKSLGEINVKTLVEDNHPTLDGNESKYANKKDSAIFNNNFRYLNKYLIMMSKKVKDMSTNFEKVDKEKSQTKKKSINDRNFDYINRSLEKITDNLKFLAISKKKNRKFTMIIQGIEKMTRQFENCAKNFESISSKPKSSIEKSYSDWIQELQTTRSGQKFISKVESCLRKTLDRERDKIVETYGIKFAKEKEILKLKYKQKIVMLMNTIQQVQEEAEYNRNLYIENERKFNEVNFKTVESSPKFTQTEEYSISNFHETVSKNQASQTVKPNDASKSDYNFEDVSPSILNLARTMAQKDKPIFQEHFRKVQHMPRKSVEFEETNNAQEKIVPQKSERFIDHIVYDAKLRIQELENETAELDKTFKEHLQKQEAFKTENAVNIQAIWKNYQRDKSLLNKKCSALRDQSAYKIKKNMLSKELNFEKILRELPKISIENIVQKYTQNKESAITVKSSQSNFENPFRELQKIFLKNTPLQSTSNIIEVRKSSGEVPATIEKVDSYPNNKIVVPDIRLDGCNDNIDDFEDIRKSSPGIQSSNLSSAYHFDLKNETLDGIEISSTKSSSTSSPPRAVSYLKVFKSKRELFPKETHTPQDSSHKKNLSNDQKEIQRISENKKKLCKRFKTIRKQTPIINKHVDDVFAKGDGMNYEPPKSTQHNSNEIETLHESKIVENKKDGNDSDHPNSSMHDSLRNSLMIEQHNKIEDNKIKINIQELTTSKNNGNESTGTNESALSVAISNSPTKNSIQSSKLSSKSSKLSPHLNDNIFQLNSFRKDEDVVKILNSSESGTSIKSIRSEFVKNKNDSEVNLNIPSPLLDESSSINSNLSLSMSIGGDVKDDKSIDDFWN